MYTDVYSTLFIDVKRQKQPNSHPLTIAKPNVLYLTTRYHLALPREKVPKHTTAWVSLEHICQVRELSHKISHIILFHPTKFKIRKVYGGCLGLKDMGEGVIAKKYRVSFKVKKM